MTEFEKYFIRMHKELNEIGLSHWLIGSSLLSLVRDGKLFENDKEVNFGVFGDDLAKVKPQLMERYDVRFSNNMSRSPGIWLTEKKNKNKKLWNIEPGFTWLAPHMPTGDKVVQFVDRKHLLIWKLKDLLPLSLEEFMGETFSVPNNPNNWMEEYFGEEWVIHKEQWHWSIDALNHINLESLC